VSQRSYGTLVEAAYRTDGARRVQEEGPTMKLLALAIALLMSVTTAHAAAYDGSAPMKCRIQAVMMCSDGSGCVR
jgi:hypothetical protein